MTSPVWSVMNLESWGRNDERTGEYKAPADSVSPPHRPHLTITNPQDDSKRQYRTIYHTSSQRRDLDIDLGCVDVATIPLSPRERNLESGSFQLGVITRGVHG